MKKSLFNLLLIGGLFVGCQQASDIGSSTGVGGSMSRFTIGNGHLYTLTNNLLRTFRLDSTDVPDLVSNVEINDVVETIFYSNQTLFIGSQNGMHIYDVSIPGRPRALSVYQHITSCDPVVVVDSLAYVTLRSTSQCQTGVNRLDVVNVKNLESPIQVSSYDITHPYGLAVFDSTLVVCQGSEGITIYDRNGTSLDLINSVPDFDAYDVIALPNFSIVTGADGIYQLDISDPSSIEELSHIPALLEI